MKGSDTERRMRERESFRELKLLPGAWTIVRVDGRAFTQFTTTRFEKPFDRRFADLMAAAARALTEGLQGAYACTQSDEVSVAFPPAWDLFDWRLEKIVSVSAGLASAAFTHARGESAHFDSRVWLGTSAEEVIEYFRWRQLDSARCALHAWCYWTLRRRPDEGRARAGPPPAPCRQRRASDGGRVQPLPAGPSGEGLKRMAHPEPGHHPRTEPAAPAGLDAFVRTIRADPRFAGEITHYRYLPPVEPLYADLAIDDRLRVVLAQQGIGRFWTHRAEAVEAVRAGRNVVVMTPTASGKSLVYNTPVIESLLADPQARALYVFPLKGLEQDQVQNLNGLLSALGFRMEAAARERQPLRPAEVYDGDTSAYRRKKIRARFPRVIFTNPDMLHLAMLPYHDRWAEFFHRLEYVVIDELHTYHGVFGSNAAHVFRRLRRACQYYGAHPKFIACSATIANSKPLAEALTDLPFVEVTKSGAPQGGRHFFFVNPEKSPYTEATALFLACLEAGQRTIVFTKARKITELLYDWSAARAGELAPRISPYRAGFLPRERREIEQRLFRGDLLGVVTTSALELGVDIGGLDVCVLVGYPGSIASTWQRAGRVGRHGEDAAIFLIALHDALDQYWMRHPQAFFGRTHEAVVIDPGNPELLKRHLPCAAAEICLRRNGPVYHVPALRPLIDELVARGALKPGRRGDIWFARARRPQREVGIRAIGEPFGLYLQSGEKLGEVSRARLSWEAFPGAIYLHRGRHYRVLGLDLEARRAVCKEGDVHYYTQALSREETEILAETARKPLGEHTVHGGRLRILRQVIGYDRRGLYDGERLSRHPLSLPEERFDTEGLWIPITPEAATRVAARFDLAGALHACEHAAIKSLPLYALCEKGDLVGRSYPLDPAFGLPVIYIYDGYEGGLGFTRRVFEVLTQWLGAARTLVAECPCEEGCPSCVQDAQCGSGNEPLDKAGAIFLLDALLSSGADSATP